MGVIKPGFIEEPTEQRHGKDYNKRKDPVEGVTERAASKAHTVISKDDSPLYIVARFPIEVVKEMMEDMFPIAEQHGQKQESARQQTETEDEGPQELTKTQKRALYTIGGLSMVWYFFGY